MADDSFVWTLNSKATLKTLGQTIKDLDVKKDLKMNGLSNFSNIKILKFDLPSDAPEGALVSIVAAVANSSPIGMNLGTITLDIDFETAALGRVVAKNCTLIGGQDMILNLEGTLVRQTDPVHLQELSLLISNYLAGIVTVASAKGISVFPDGVNAVSYLTKAIQAMTMKVPLVSPTPLNVIQSLDIKDMSLTVTPETAWNPTVSSNAVVANFKLPFNISLNITELANATMTLVYKGTPLADLTTAVWNQTTSEMPNKIVFSLPPSPLNVKDDAHDAFQAFLTETVQNADTGFDIKGSVDAVASTNLGIVRLKVQLNSPVVLKGIAFATNSPTISDANAYGGTTEHVLLKVNVTIDNPSIFTIDAGPVTLQLSGSVSGLSGIMGEVQFSSLSLAPGRNVLTPQIFFHPADPALRDEFFSKFIIGNVFDCTITGMDGSTAISSMAPVLKSLVLKVKVPGLTPIPLVTGANGIPTVGSVLGNRQLPVTFGIQNPVLTTFGVINIDASVSWQGHPFGTVTSETYFEVAASAKATSPTMSIQLPTDFNFGVFMITTFLPANLGIITGANVNIDFEAKFGVTVGGPPSTGYQATLGYTQKAISAFLKVDFGFGATIKKRAEDYGITLPGPEPSVENSAEYLEWLKASLFAAYPEEAKRYLEGNH
ncbi:hypothetical protein BGZ76_004958 [Entomortierella beljakovae]|nr:hypothetical protein BGZ76_004958 [Entomortierella beljakovae]